MSEARAAFDRAMSEDDLLELVLDAATVGGRMAYHVRRSDRAITIGAGFPDLVLAGDGRVVFVELKTEAGRLTEDQRRWRVMLEGCGAEYRLWRPSSWREIEAELLGRSAPAETAR